ncbi:SCP2 sterol-binding domain-containing protein [Haloechinothrix halophila]|uniref:SCP2 sterol-binding domain-containing protein n=1 Tax=Haloechinothrix halophila TaxID=1069073 RepID=UPI000422BD87|nr:SCP2 sterol-binding domain-containing protein [Haloechinothrix halophila]
MPDNASIDALPSLRGHHLIETLETIEPTDVTRAGLGPDAIVRAVDPAQLDRSGVRRLLDALRRIGAAVPSVNLSDVESATFATLIATASRAQLDDVFAKPDLREALLNEAFQRMRQHVRPDRVGRLHAVVRWRLTGGDGNGGIGGAGYDRYECHFADGGCTVRAGATDGTPRATITVSPVDFLRLTTRQATPAVLFVTGKLNVKGDLGFAAGLIRYFDLPSPRT